MEKLKEFLAKIMEFTTGLGFYGIGLLAIGLVLWWFFPGQFLTNIGFGFIGAFVFKNWQAIYNYFKGV